MRAAVEAAEGGADVAIVSKMHPVRSHSGAAQGGINAALGNREEDTPQAHTFDTVKGSDYLGDQDAVAAMCEDAPKQIIWLEHRGCIFSRMPDGRIAQRPFGGAGVPRTCYSADVTGLVILHTLWEQLERLGVKVYEEYFCTALASMTASVPASSRTTCVTASWKRSPRRRRSLRPAAQAVCT